MPRVSRGQSLSVGQQLFNSTAERPDMLSMWDLLDEFGVNWTCTHVQVAVCCRGFTVQASAFETVLAFARQLLQSSFSVLLMYTCAATADCAARLVLHYRECFAQRPGVNASEHGKNMFVIMHIICICCCRKATERPKSAPKAHEGQ